MLRVRAAAVLLSALAAAGGAAVAQPPRPIVFRGATVIDGTGRAPIVSATIVVTGERITAVGPDTAVSPPADAQVIDARGRTIFPGLADLHVHLQGGWDGERRVPE